METEINILLKEFSERPIAYQPIYAKITGSATAGILLSQLVYWHYAMKEKEFYKTDNDFCNELSLGLYELRGAKKKLQELGVVIVNRKGVPAKTYYKVDIKRLFTLITSCGKNPQLVVGKTNNKSEEKPTTITESNTENNTKNPIYGKNFFFNLPINQKKLYLEDKLSRSLDDSENKQVKDFCSFWTESNSDGSKQKWQFEKTFDIVRRFKRWLSNEKKWNKKGTFKKRANSYDPNEKKKPTSNKYARFVKIIKV